MTRPTSISPFALMLGLLVGCSHQGQVASVAPAPPPALEDVEAQPASALVFQSAVAELGPSVDLSRSRREPSAFVGFDSPITTYLYEETDDRQSSDGRNLYERRTLSYRLGSSTR